jgi:tetratricopeptide (TPR) repeat protein
MFRHFAWRGNRLCVAALWFVASLAANPSMFSVANAAANETVLGDRKVIFLEQRLKRDPDDFIAANQLTAIRLERFRATGRLDELRKADSVSAGSYRSVLPELNKTGLTLRAETLTALHRFAEAAEVARRYEAVAPDQPQPQMLLGDALLELGDLDGARAAYESMKTRGGTGAAMEHRLARLAWATGRLDDLERHLDAVVAAVPRDDSELRAWAMASRGEFALRRGRLAQAERDLLAALRLNPDHWRIMETLGALRGAQGRDDEALKLLEQVAANTERPECWQAVGDFHAAHHRSEPAEAAYAKALAGYTESLSRGEWFYIHHLAGFYTDAKPDPARAVEFARRDLEIRKSSAAWDGLAWALHRAGDFPGAADAAKNALSTGTVDAQILTHAGTIQLSLGNVDEGKKLLKRAKETNPHLSHFHSPH